MPCNGIYMPPCVYYDTLVTYDPLQAICICIVPSLSQSTVELTSITKRALTHYIEDTCDQHSPNDYRLACPLSSMWSHVVMSHFDIK